MRMNINALKNLTSKRAALIGSHLCLALLIGGFTVLNYMANESKRQHEAEMKEAKIIRGLELQQIVFASVDYINENLLADVAEKQKQTYAIAHTLYCEGDNLNVVDFRGIGESIRGRIASPHYPDTAYEVVYEERTHRRTKREVAMYSFSQTKCMTQRPVYTGPKWQLSLQVAKEVTNSEENGLPIIGITHYFARYIPTPDWAQPETCEFVEVPIKGAFHAFFRPITSAEAKECRVKYAPPVVVASTEKQQELPVIGPVPAKKPVKKDEVASLILATN